MIYPMVLCNIFARCPQHIVCAAGFTSSHTTHPIHATGSRAKLSTKKSIAVDQSRVERGVKSRVDQSSQSAIVLDRSCSSTDRVDCLTMESSRLASEKSSRSIVDRTSLKSSQLTFNTYEVNEIGSVITHIKLSNNQSWSSLRIYPLPVRVR